MAARYAATASQSDDLQALQQEACHVAAEGLKADFAMLLVYQAEGRDFVVQAGLGWRPGVIGRSRLEADVGTAAGFAWHTGRAVISNALTVDARFRAPNLLVEHGLTRSIAVRVPGDERAAFGVLEVESSNYGEFALDDGDFLQLLAHSLAAARDRLMRQTLHEQAVRSIDEHQMSLREMQHRIRNDLQGICSSIAREIRTLDDAKQRVGYDRVSRRVLALAGLYDHLLGLPPGDTIEMGAYLGSLCLRIAAASELPSRSIALGADTQPVELPIERAARLAVAVNELVANAVEHAFPNGQAGKVMVRLFARAEGIDCPVLTVSDDGCGFKEPGPGSAGLGFVERLVRGAGGVLTRLDAGGTEWRIVLPS